MLDISNGKIYWDGVPYAGSYEVVVSGSGSLRHGSKVRVVNRDGVDITLDNKTELTPKAPSLPAASGLNQSAAVAPTTVGS